ncbi:MAG TPA: Rieske 2Fe-2S domain-containing protein [Kofleriaceae bacterium]|nr:Rieske 2Fe-2S domain-containing protein [Kofleriaceae bacterium]
MGFWVRVGSTDEVPAGEVRGFHVAQLSFPVMVAHVGDGRFLAATSICPHEDVSLLHGELQGTVINCPGHGYEFDLVSGRCPHDAGLRLRRFAVRVEGDGIYVEIDLHRPHG